MAGQIAYQPSLPLNPTDFNEVIGTTRKAVSYSVQATADVANSPTGVQSPVRGYLEVTNIANSYVSQRFLDYRLNAAFLRTLSGGTWTPWQRIDNFGYNTLAELASGVAGQMRKRVACPVLNANEEVLLVNVSGTTGGLIFVDDYSLSAIFAFTRTVKNEVLVSKLLGNSSKTLRADGYDIYISSTEASRVDLKYTVYVL